MKVMHKEFYWKLELRVLYCDQESRYSVCLISMPTVIMASINDLIIGPIKDNDK